MAGNEVAGDEIAGDEPVDDGSVGNEKKDSVIIGDIESAGIAETGGGMVDGETGDVTTSGE